MYIKRKIMNGHFSFLFVTKCLGFVFDIYKSFWRRIKPPYETRSSSVTLSPCYLVTFLVTLSPVFTGKSYLPPDTRQRQQ